MECYDNHVICPHCKYTGNDLQELAPAPEESNKVKCPCCGVQFYIDASEMQITYTTYV